MVGRELIAIFWDCPPPYAVAGNRSHPGQQRWRGLLGDAGFDRLRDVVEHAACLKTAGLNDGQHAFDEEAALHALSAERRLPPDHCMTKRSFGSVVGRLDAFVVNERPEPLSVRVELVAHACEPLVARTGATQQERIDLGATGAIRHRNALREILPW